MSRHKSYCARLSSYISSCTITQVIRIHTRPAPSSKPCRYWCWPSTLDQTNPHVRTKYTNHISCVVLLIQLYGLLFNKQNFPCKPLPSRFEQCDWMCIANLQVSSSEASVNKPKPQNKALLSPALSPKCLPQLGLTRHEVADGFANPMSGQQSASTEL